MTYRLARNAAADQLWFDFLTTTKLDRASKRKLLTQGFTPPEIAQVNDALDFSSSEMQTLVNACQGQNIATTKPLMACHLLPWGKQPAGVW